MDFNSFKNRLLQPPIYKGVIRRETLAVQGGQGVRWQPQRLFCEHHSDGALASGPPLSGPAIWMWMEGFSGVPVCRFTEQRSSRPLGTVQLASWGFQRGARCLTMHKYISNEIIVHGDSNLVTNEHVGLKSKPSSASVGASQVIAEV